MYWTAEVSVLRGKIARLVEANQRLLGFIDPEGIADAILEMPEIAEALEYTAHVIANLMPNETTLEFTGQDGDGKMSRRRYYRAWASDNTVGEPPEKAPLFEADERTIWEIMRDDFREIQRRGW